MGKGGKIMFYPGDKVKVEHPGRTGHGLTGVVSGYHKFTTEIDFDLDEPFTPERVGLLLQNGLKNRNAWYW
jgi:hypothetical protein